MFLWQKSGKFIVAFGRNGPKRAFLAKKSKTRILPRNFFCHYLKDQQDKAMIGSPEKSMTKQKLEEQVSNAIFSFFIHDIKKKSHSLKDIHV